MKTSLIGLLSVAVLLVAGGAGPGTAKADETGWWVEEGMGSSFDSSLVIMEETLMQSPVETGLLPSAGESEAWVEPEMGSSFDYLPDRAD